MSAPITPLLPEQVYVPSTGDTTIGQRVLLARDLDGNAELFCFTSPERLRRSLGRETPWLRLCREEVRQLIRLDNVTRLQVDAVVESTLAVEPLPAQRPGAAPASYSL